MGMAPFQGAFMNNETRSLCLTEVRHAQNGGSAKDSQGIAEEQVEAELARFFKQQIEDGYLLAEDIPLQLARYGLMEPLQFSDEIRERIALAAEDR
jgi:hypothetical protein